MFSRYWLMGVVLILLGGCVPSSNKLAPPVKQPVTIQYNDVAVNQQLVEDLELSGSTQQVTALCVRGEVFLIGYLSDTELQQRLVADFRNNIYVLRVVTGWSVAPPSAEDLVVLEKVRKRLAEYPSIRVGIFDGATVLVGQCRSGNESDLVVAAVKSVPGVRQIVNYLRITD